MIKNAVVIINGNQYLLSPKDQIWIDGEKITDSKVLLYWQDEEPVLIGKPYLDKYLVTFNTLKSEKSKKVSVMRFKAKSRYKKTKGHRQIKSLIEVVDISTNGA